MMIRLIAVLVFSLLLNAAPVLAAMPTTTNYGLNSYGFGSGGANSSTSNYALQGTTGELSGATGSTATYQSPPGYIQTQQSNVPVVTLTNPSNYYDKLHFVIDTQGNPTDAKYALQVSTTSDFSSGNKYVKNDLTLTNTLTTSDYQTYTSWGGGSGSNIIGLAASTTYYIRAKATHLTSFSGISSESAYGPGDDAATVSASLSFCLYTGANCAAGGNAVALGTLLPATVTDGGNNIGIDFATNAGFGGKVYIYGTNGGLNSSRVSYSVASSTTDLSVASEGFGAKILSVSETSGGPLTKVSPYNGASDNVGAIVATASQLLSSVNPIVGGTSSIQLKGKASSTTPSANDYQETLTFIAAANF